ncbi:lamin tail domain-containing protein 2 [Rhinolophus sinicus]|uniref:lamin tail domain-containing protein 2 n=1 Tax=Rhinolophus sinicus TaxID=89399 RepID=UPI003D7B2368
MPPELPPAPPPDDQGSELCAQHMERHLKNVEWSSLPLGGTSSSGDTSSSGGANSDSSSPQRDMRFPVHVTRHPPQAPGHASEQTESQARSFHRGSQAEPADLPETHSEGLGKTVLVPRFCATPDHRQPGHRWSQTSSCLKIVTVSRRKRFVRIFNESQEETADLGGFTLQQLSCHSPVRMYRFPPHTLLAPRHHITIWGEGPDSSKKQPPSSLAQEPIYFHSNRGCVTLLLSPKGEVLSEHQAPHCVTPVSKIFDDDTDLSIDRFPLPDARPGANICEQRCTSRPPPYGPVRETQAGRLRPGWGPLPRLLPRHRPARVVLPPPPPTPDRIVPPLPQAPPSPDPPPTLIQDFSQTPTSPCPVPPAPPLSAGGLWPSRPHRPTMTRAVLPRLSTSKLFHPPEVPARPASAETHVRKLLPAVPRERARGRGRRGGRGGRGRPARTPIILPRRGPSGHHRLPGQEGAQASGVQEERGPGLPDGGAVGPEHRREQIRFPLPQLPAHHRGRLRAGVGPV